MPDTAAVAAPQCSVGGRVFAMGKKEQLMEGLGPPKTQFRFFSYITV